MSVRTIIQQIFSQEEVKVKTRYLNKLVCEMLQNASREHLCLELRHQSRRATNTDAVLVTEEGEEVTAHQAVLSLHSQLLKTLLMKNRSNEVPRLILCGVSKTVLIAFISLLYCGEVILDKSGIESLTELLRRLDVDTDHLSFPGFLVKTHFNFTTKAKFQGVDEKETKASNFEDIKLETGSDIDEEIFRNDNFDGAYDSDIQEHNEEEYNTKKDNDETIEKFSVIPIVKSGTGTDLRKIRYDPDFLKKKKEEEIQQGIRLPNGRKKKKNLNPQKEKTGKFMCPECGIVVVRKSSLKTHIQEVHQGIMYPCDQCPHQARSKRSLKYHIETSHEGKRYYCDQCEYAAISNGNLKKHIRETHCERNHKCDNCDFKAKTAETLKAHINAIHLKIKFTCPDCGSKHSQQGHLTKHRRMKHGYKTREYATHKQFALV